MGFLVKDVNKELILVEEKGNILYKITGEPVLAYVDYNIVKETYNICNNVGNLVDILL